MDCNVYPEDSTTTSYYSIKYISKVNVGVKKSWPHIAHVELIQDEVLESVCEVNVADQHSALHLATQKDDPNKRLPLATLVLLHGGLGR